MATTYEAILRAQELVNKYVDPDRSVVDEFITERRLEALGEEDHEYASARAADQVKVRGFAVCEDVLSPEVVTRMLDALARADQSSTLRRSGGIFAVRNLLEVCSEVESLAYSKLIRHYVEPVMDIPFFPVRGILFDKIPGANWKVPWHQDVTIAVKERVEVEGFGPWSVKSGVQHVQPPASVLEEMLSVRIHLDDCGPDNGALKVLPGSHLLGKLGQEQMTELSATSSPEVCAVRAGGVLLMRPLLLHASSAAVNPDHRRVIHIDFACAKLPSGLKWALE